MWKMTVMEIIPVMVLHDMGCKNVVIGRVGWLPCLTGHSETKLHEAVS